MHKYFPSTSPQSPQSRQSPKSQPPQGLNTARCVKEKHVSYQLTGDNIYIHSIYVFVSSADKTDLGKCKRENKQKMRYLPLEFLTEWVFRGALNGLLIMKIHQTFFPESFENVSYIFMSICVAKRLLELYKICNIIFYNWNYPPGPL